jgi:hypothetical protein
VRSNRTGKKQVSKRSERWEQQEAQLRLLGEQLDGRQGKWDRYKGGITSVP